MTLTVKVNSLEAVVWSSLVRRIKQVGTICITSGVLLKIWLKQGKEKRLLARICRICRESASHSFNSWEYIIESISFCQVHPAAFGDVTDNNSRHIVERFVTR